METVIMPEAPDRYEQAARMKYVEGKTWAQIARTLGVPKTSMERIKRKLRQDLKIALKIMVLMRHENPRKSYTP